MAAGLGAIRKAMKPVSIVGLTAAILRKNLCTVTEYGNGKIHSEMIQLIRCRALTCLGRMQNRLLVLCFAGLLEPY
jgi:hypothetical protein